MAKKDNTHPLLQEIKNSAKDHQAFEQERGKTLIYGHALDIASKKLVNVDWNTACAMAKKGTLTIIGTNDVSDEEMSRMVELANSGELEFEEFDMRHRSTQDEINSYMEVVKANVGVHVAIIEDNISFTIPDFHPPKPQKIFYTKRNHLMSEHESIISDPNFFEIPYELESIDEMNAWIEKQGGGALFFPTNSIADLKESMKAKQSAVESNNNFFKYLNADHTKSKMKKGR